MIFTKIWMDPFPNILKKGYDFDIFDTKMSCPPGAAAPCGRQGYVFQNIREQVSSIFAKSAQSTLHIKY
jgi:hypothetical protein